MKKTLVVICLLACLPFLLPLEDRDPSPSLQTFAEKAPAQRISIAEALQRPVETKRVLVLQNGQRIEIQGLWEENGKVKYFKDGEISKGISKSVVKWVEQNDSGAAAAGGRVDVAEALRRADEGYRILVLKNGQKIRTRGIWEENGLIRFRRFGGATGGIARGNILAVEKDPIFRKRQASTPPPKAPPAKKRRQVENYIKRSYKFTDHRNRKHRVRIRLPEQDVADSRDLYQKFTIKRRLPGGRRFMMLDYREIQKWQIDMLEEAYGALRQVGRKNQMSGREFTILLARFVQHLRYKLPKTPFGFWPPLVCLEEKAGDCDSKSTLFATLFHHFRKNGCILILTRRHAFIGIRREHKIFPRDVVTKIGGIDYLLLEATNVHRLGYVAPNQLQAIKRGRFQVIPFY